MKKFCFSVATMLSIGFVFGQSDSYFQQQTDYKIDVTLDDKAHTISGNLEIAYTNNSPVELSFIYFHFWGNAFKDPNSAFGKQKLRMGSTKFFFAGEEELGCYSGLDFKVNGEKAELSFDKDNPDIAQLKLLRPLKSKESIVITSPFTLKIPASFSRLGHVGQSYQMTQWYPKPAVFDHTGWHPMPYLDMGEFYSEFGTYEVSITLPDNYVAGASGFLQTESEHEFLKDKVEATKKMYEAGNLSSDESFPESSAKMKTIRFRAEDVHDFAWFADKRFHVQQSQVSLPSGRKVDTWTMFTNEQVDLWKESITYVDRSVAFYSELVGEYPYPHATAVHSALSAGGGMEYPMITVIGKSSTPKGLDQVITHEVGHNWFYGILANNEREEPWMDEGINSYYEHRYTTKYYGSRIVEQLPAFMTKKNNLDLYETAWLLQARRRLDQAPSTSSDDFSPLNYGIVSYIKVGSAFRHLENYLGTATYDAIMKSFYQQWKFRHFYPKDLRQHFEQESGKNLDWFFDGYISSNGRFDYSIESIDEDIGAFKITVKNRGGISAPFPIAGIKNDKVVSLRWFEPDRVNLIQEVNFPKGDYDLVVLDAGHVTMDVFRKNNNLKTSGLFKKIEPLQLKLLGALENGRTNTLFWLPVAGFNKYDGMMPGLAVYNYIVPAKKLEFSLATTYGLSSKDLNGTGSIRYNIFPVSEKLRRISFGLNAKAFNYRNPDSLRTETGYTSAHLQYRRIVPFVRVELMRSPASQFYQTIEARSIFVREQKTEFLSGQTGTFYNGNVWQNKTINQLSWEIGNRQVLNPYSLNVTLEQQHYNDFFGAPQDYLKAALEFNSSYVYDLDKAMHFRVFVGKFFQNSDRKNRGLIFEEAFNLTSQGFNDYKYDDYYFGRTESEGFFSRQIMPNEGGMKVALGSPYSQGRSNDFIVAVNLKSDLPKDLPFKLPLKPYFDIAYYNDTRPISSDLTFNDQLWWQGGLTIEAIKGIFALHLPIVSSKNALALYKQSGREGFFQRVSFTIDMAKLNPWALIEDNTR